MPRWSADLMRTYSPLIFLLLLGCYSTQDLTGQLPDPEEDVDPFEEGELPDDEPDGSDDDDDDEPVGSDDDDDEPVGSDDDDDEPDPDPINDDAEIAFSSFPPTLTCGEVATATVTVRNTGAPPGRRLKATNWEPSMIPTPSMARTPVSG